MSDLLAQFETSMDNMQKMIRWASAPFDTEKHDQVYLNLAEDELRTIANAGEAVIAYCNFSKPFVRNIDLHEDIDDGAGVESIVKVPQLEDFLGFVGGQHLDMELHGDAESGRATKMRILGDISAEIFLPNSKTDYESKQLGIVFVYDDDENFVKASTFEMGEEPAENGEPLQTSFTTDCEQFNRIIDVVEFDSFALSNYPVVIEDEEFVLRATDENERDSVDGTLKAENVEGPDVESYYSRSFPQLFSTIGGEVDVRLGKEKPISIVRESNDEAMTLRYSILPVG